KALAITPAALIADIQSIYRAHNIKSRAAQANRRALAQKLGLPFATKSDHLKTQAAALRQQGLTWKEIASEMGLAAETARNYGRKQKTKTTTKTTQDPHVAEPVKII